MRPDDHYDMPGNPNVWSDGSCVTDDLASISVAGAGAVSDQSGVAWHSGRWRHLDVVPLENGLGGGERGMGVASSVVFLDHCSLYRGPNFGGLFWPFRLALRFRWLHSG